MCPNTMAPGAHSSIVLHPTESQDFLVHCLPGWQLCTITNPKFFQPRYSSDCEHLVARMLSGLHPDLGGIDSLRASKMSPSHETRWDGSYPGGIPSVQEHLCCWRREGITSSLPPLSCLCLLIILPWEGTQWVKKAA